MVAEEIARGFFEQRQLLRGDGFVVDRTRAAGQTGEAVVINPVAVGEEFKRNEQRIAGEGRERGVRRVAVAGGPKRENLPEALLGSGQEIGEGIRSGAEVADAAE